MNDNTATQYHLHYINDMSFIIVKLELPFTLKPVEIAADLRQLLAVEQFSDLPLVTGDRPEVGGTLQWGQRRRYSLR